MFPCLNIFVFDICQNKPKQSPGPDTQGIFTIQPSVTLKIVREQGACGVDNADQGTETTF
jgi:hypothetical protein